MQPQTKDGLPACLITAKELVYDPSGFLLTNFTHHTESSEYEACSFALNSKQVEYRLAKITPTKIGQFVTIWKRNEAGITAPFDQSDKLDFILVAARSGDNFGQFIFSKAVLVEKGILSKKGKGGKRGIRVYPPWDKPTSKQAEKTQAWQSAYFLIIQKNPIPDITLFKKLFLEKD